ncbi:hypothetical protein WA026_021997 [Henosepilachna vigintioctopunctata]|uniref:Uncharacterized protein n=1 Tax=Henosepilachna vigintioctopunctata TaxID=420089 RepID=A0AAW1VJ82_9CUCU
MYFCIKYFSNQLRKVNHNDQHTTNHIGNFTDEHFISELYPLITVSDDIMQNEPNDPFELFFVLYLTKKRKNEISILCPPLKENGSFASKDESPSTSDFQAYFV